MDTSKYRVSRVRGRGSRAGAGALTSISRATRLNPAGTKGTRLGASTAGLSRRQRLLASDSRSAPRHLQLPRSHIAKGSDRDDRRERRETAAIGCATCVLGMLYLWHGLVSRVRPGGAGPPGPTEWLGFDRWAALHPAWSWLFLALALLAGLAAALRPAGSRRVASALGRATDLLPVRLAAAAASVAVFWFASTGRLNYDGSLLEQKFRADVPRLGAHLTHDEILELYVHSRLWDLAHTAWGWSVARTYRATSCLAGGVVVYLALGFARRFEASRRPLVLAGLFAGGWVLIFFGDVENYTLANAWVLAYLLAAWRFLDGRSPFWPAAALLAVAAVFHAEAAVLGPSLLVLGLVALRSGRTRDVAAGATLAAAVVAATLWWFDSRGLPIERLLTHSHLSAQGGEVARYLAPLDGRYLWTQAQLLFLLAPGVALLPALVVARGWRQPGQRRRTLFLGTAVAGVLTLHFLWRAQLGVYDDWNLYAIVAQPVALLVFGTLAETPGSRARAAWLAAFLALAAAHSAAWVVENHAALRSPRITGPGYQPHASAMTTLQDCGVA